MKKVKLTGTLLGIAGIVVFASLSSGAMKMKPKPIREKRVSDMKSLLKYGEKLWKSTSLGKSGKSCATCHSGGAMLSSDDFPKFINMAGDILTLDQMVNFCIMNPLKGKPLSWNSREMTALVAYVEKIRRKK